MEESRSFPFGKCPFIGYSSTASRSPFPHKGRLTRKSNSPINCNLFAKVLDNRRFSVYNKSNETNPKGISIMDCLFCKIIAGDIPSAKVYEDDMVCAFRDIAPMAPTHILIVPKAHLSSADEVTAENSGYVARIFEVIPKIAAAEGLANGYRVITNFGEDGCQSVKHLHFHLLGGKKLPDQMA